jgi:hypothetical protein
VTGRKRRRAPPEPVYVPGTLLNWNDSSHWDYITGPQPCRYECGGVTQLRDSHGKPAHKCCAEEALARQHAEAAEAYQNGQTT